MGLLLFSPLGLTSTHLLLGCLVLASCYWGINTAYYLFFSPLAHVPGPFLAKISRLPSYYHAVKGDRHLWIWQCHQTYGQKVRLTPDAVDFQSPQALRDILGFKSNVSRSKHYEVWQMSKTNVNTITTSDVLLHHKKRRYLNLVFTEKSVRTAGLFIQTHVDLWNKLLPDGEDWSQPKNVSDWIDYLVFDILCDLCFGRSLGTKNPGENPFKGIPKAIHTHMKFMYPITHSPLLGFLLWSQSKGLNRLFEIIMPSDIRDYYRFVQDSVAARIKAEQASEQHDKDGKEMRQDMIHFLYHAIDPQTGRRAYSQQELFCEANLLVTAGSDTTAITLSGFFFYIVRNPGPYKKLVREIRSTFNSADEITGGCKLSSCKYLRACVDESLRITPAVPSELCRTILPGGQIIDNEFYPAGIVVSTSGYTTGRSDGYGDPNTFRPERWIVDEAAGRTADEVARISSYIRPFSAGWSNCVGQNLAMLELLITIARTLYRLDVRAAPGSTLGEGNPDLGWGRGEKDEFQLFDAFVAMRDGPMVQFKRREES